MSDSAPALEPSATSPATSPAAKKSKAAKLPALKKPRIKPTHPPTAEMVNNAIKTLKERGGSSLQAIKKFITSNYKIDAEKLSPFIKKYLRNAVIEGKLVQTKGKGASGSFKLPTNAVKPKAAVKKTKPALQKAGKEKKVKKLANKKPPVEKKKAPAAPAKKEKTPIIIKTVVPKQKTTKPTKTDEKKPKAPIPKKVSSKKTAVAGTVKKAKSAKTAKASKAPKAAKAAKAK